MIIKGNPLLAPEWMMKLWTRLSQRVSAPETCRVCDQPAMQVHQVMTTMSEYRVGGTVHMGSAVIPFAMLTCSNCGNTQLHNLLELGVIDEDGNVIK